MTLRVNAARTRARPAMPRRPIPHALVHSPFSSPTNLSRLNPQVRVAAISAVFAQPSRHQPVPDPAPTSIVKPRPTQGSTYATHSRRAAP